MKQKAASPQKCSKAIKNPFFWGRSKRRLWATTEVFLVSQTRKIQAFCWKKRDSHPNVLYISKFILLQTDMTGEDRKGKMAKVSMREGKGNPRVHPTHHRGQRLRVEGQSQQKKAF